MEAFSLVLVSFKDTPVKKKKNYTTVYSRIKEMVVLSTRCLLGSYPESRSEVFGAKSLLFISCDLNYQYKTY